MVNQYKICYTAQWPDGKPLDPKKPYTEAYVLASTKREAMGNLLAEFPGLKVRIVEEPQQVETNDED